MARNKGRQHSIIMSLSFGVIDFETTKEGEEEEQEIQKETGKITENKEIHHVEKHKPDLRIHEFVLPIIGSSLVFLIAFALRDAISASFDLLPIKTPKVWNMWILVMLKLILVIIVFVSLNFVGLTKVFPGCQ
jgi:hypothetical protein